MPILLTDTNTLPSQIETYINNHPEIKKFIIVGGVGSVSDTVKTKLQSLNPSATVERIDGADRYEVGLNIISYFNLDISNLIFNNSLDFPDSMSSGPLSAYMNAPILLTQPDVLNSKISNYLDTVKGQFYFIDIVGGVITNVVEQALNSKLG